MLGPCFGEERTLDFGLYTQRILLIDSLKLNVSWTMKYTHGYNT